MIPRCQIPGPQADQQMRPNPETEVSFVLSSFMVTLCKKVAKLFDEASQPEHNMHSSLTCLSFLENVSTCSQVQCKAQPDCADEKGLNSNNPHLTFEQLHGLIQHVCHVNAMSNTRQRKGAQLQITGGFPRPRSALRQLSFNLKQVLHFAESKRTEPSCLAKDSEIRLPHNRTLT